MSLEYRAKFTVTGNGDVYKKSFNGTCAIGVNRRARGSIAKRAEAYLQAVTHSQASSSEMVTSSKKKMPYLEVVSRVAAIPIVETSIGATEKMYLKIRESNPLVRWYLALGERSLTTGLQLALPVVQLLENPITQFDKFLCKSLDVVEKRVPSIYMPPQAIYSETRQYVMRRADSVKQLGAAVLESRVTAATATAVDRALTTADKYVDKYLPPDNRDGFDVTCADAVDGACEPEAESPRERAAHAVQHGARLSRKLQRRLTRQALAEAKAIREQIHVLAYVAELVATDPVLAWQKAKELYSSLSQPEPENQARPATFEELMVLLAREAARKMVHLINFTHTDLPKNIREGMSNVTRHLATVADALLKTVPIESAITEVRGWQRKLETILHQLQDLSRTYMVNLALFLAGNEELEKIAPRSPRSSHSPHSPREQHEQNEEYEQHEQREQHEQNEQREQHEPADPTAVNGVN